LKSINRKIATLKDALIKVKPRFATVEEVQMVHSKTLIQEVQRYSKMEMPIDLDTVLSKESYKSDLKLLGLGWWQLMEFGRENLRGLSVLFVHWNKPPNRAMGFGSLTIFGDYREKICPKARLSRGVMDNPSFWMWHHGKWDSR